MLYWVNIHAFHFGLAAMGLATAVYIVQNWLCCSRTVAPLGEAGAPPALRANEGRRCAASRMSPGMNRFPAAQVSRLPFAPTRARKMRGSRDYGGRGERPKITVNVARIVVDGRPDGAGDAGHPNGLSGALYSVV